MELFLSVIMDKLPKGILLNRKIQKSKKTLNETLEQYDK
jgi:hypothetical protein